MTPNAPRYLKETPSQTAGPYVHIGLAPEAAGLRAVGRPLAGDPAAPGCPGRRIAVEGVVLDGTGTPLRDALIEVWQADHMGRHRHPEDPRANEVDPRFRGFGRVCAGFEDGLWRFETVKPGPVPWPGGGLQAPHITFWIVARGINMGLHTRMYFGDEPEANAADPLLAMIEQPSRRETLISRPEPDPGGGPTVHRFEIRLQGPLETVFLDV
ncbi:protocatechuate 3,4-dioxygenase subunit alpha [Oceanicella actignis]|uniref:protocatechuate 3,4-dioxygenase subunit alpha n=1 Tax=Oceanicella actignis TaxID=1189325 RepID=UPI0011E64018|nr:protocatechuate 3,4-dioxygenase subunit alpha [Oceanicella actignis]TYO88521.1 protocatechuate 3,4-dioxygenase alpha subunit [Oceanicella actignis]